MSEFLSAAVLREASLVHLFAFAVAAGGLLWVRMANAAPGSLLARAAAHPRLVSVAYLVLGNAHLLVSRLASIHFDALFNPDEAQMTAHAMQVCHGAFGWGGMDGGSAGPLLSIVLAWPCLLGGDVSMLTARLTAAAFLGATATLAFLVARRAAGVEVAILVTFPLFVFLGATHFFDFTHYSTELLPILLMMAAVAAFFRLDAQARPSRRLLAGTGGAFVALGLLPLAKLQAMPIGAVIGFALLLRLAGMARRGLLPWRTAAATVLLAAAPAALALGLTALQGDFRHFLNSYLLWVADYVTTPLGMGGFAKLATDYGFFRQAFASLAALLAIALCARAVSASGLAPAQRAGALLGLALLPAVYVSIVTSGRHFYHYLHYTLPFLAVAAAAVFAGEPRPAPLAGRRFGWASLAALAALAWVLVPAARSEILANPAFSREGRFLVTPAQAASNLMAWLRPAREDSLVIWGWMPQWYFRLGLPPGTREVTARNQIVESSQRPYFRSRWLEDFERNRPDFIMDAVVPGSFAFQDPNTQSLASWPQFGQLVARDFVEISAARGPAGCPKTYVRRSRWESLGKSLVEVAGIAADAEAVENGVHYVATALDDRHVLEACEDYWLLPEGRKGGVTLKLAGPERVAEVALLDTRGGGRGDRGAKSVRVSLLHEGRRVHEQVVKPEPFPVWTRYRLAQPVLASEVRIDIEEFRGRGGGLNEVKIYRSAP